MEIFKQTELPLKSAFYIRVSTDEQAEMYGQDLQLESLHNMVKAKPKHFDGSLSVLPPTQAHIYEDDISGTVPLSERPAFSRLMEDYLNADDNNKPFDIVFVYKLDRLARRLSILLDASNFFDEQKIRLSSVHENIDTSTPFGRAMLGIIGVIAELELETIKQRTSEGRRQAILRGVYMGTPPFGYKKDEEGCLIPLKNEATIVKTIFDLYAFAGFSKQAIANKLYEDDVKAPKYSKTSKPNSRSINPITFWSNSTIGKILEDEVYTGKYYFNKTEKKKQLPKEKWELSPHRHFPIIDALTFSKVQERLGRSSLERNKTKATDTYILSGLLKCACCYDPERDIDGMQTWHGERRKLESGNVTHMYKCRRKNRTKTVINCPAVPLPALEIERIVKDFVIQLLENPKDTYNYYMDLKSTKLASDSLQHDLERYLDLLNAIPLQKERCAELFKSTESYGKDKYDKDIEELNKKEENFKKKITDIESKLSKLNLSTNYKTTLALYKEEYLNALKSAETKPKEIEDILKKVVDEIVVYSRPLNENEKVAGAKKEKQQIPYKLDIKLRLPKQMLADLALFAQKEAEEYDYKLLVDSGITKFVHPKTGKLIDITTKEGKEAFLENNRFGVKNNPW